MRKYGAALFITAMLAGSGFAAAGIATKVARFGSAKAKPGTTGTVTVPTAPDTVGETGPRAGKVTICHRPPGNPDNARTITVGEPAVAAHLAHGDTLGECADDTEATARTDKSKAKAKAAKAKKAKAAKAKSNANSAKAKKSKANKSKANKSKAKANKSKAKANKSKAKKANANKSKAKGKSKAAARPEKRKDKADRPQGGGRPDNPGPPGSGGKPDNGKGGKP